MTNVVKHYVQVGDAMSPDTKRQYMDKKWLVVGLTTHANKLIFLCVDEVTNNFVTFEVEKMKFHSHYEPKEEKKRGNNKSDTVGTGDSGVSAKELQTTN